MSQFLELSLVDVEVVKWISKVIKFHIAWIHNHFVSLKYYRASRSQGSSAQLGDFDLWLHSFIITIFNSFQFASLALLLLEIRLSLQFDSW